MNETPKNRRLQIMPEVLPAPTVSKPGAPSSSVRNQTLSHMQRLLAAAAAIPLASCTRTDSQGTQTVTIPVASASATAQDTAQGSLLPPPSATVTATAQPTATHDMGYAVVDPMPAPARCMGLASASKASASFKKEAGGALVLEFALTLPTTGPTWNGTKFQAGQKASSWAGSLVSSHVTGSTMVARVNVSPGSTTAGVSIPVDCAAGPGSIGINASFSSIAEGAKVTLTTHDY